MLFCLAIRRYNIHKSPHKRPKQRQLFLQTLRFGDDQINKLTNGREGRRTYPAVFTAMRERRVKEKARKEAGKKKAKKKKKSK